MSLQKQHVNVLSDTNSLPRMNKKRQNGTINAPNQDPNNDN